MKYYAISHNDVIYLGLHESLASAELAKSVYFKNAIYPCAVVNQNELLDIYKKISRSISILNMGQL